MPTWHELREHARTKYQLNKVEDDWFSLVWAYEAERSQQIVVRRYEAFGQEWIEFRSYVCKGDEMSPKAALRKNSDLDLGALALDSDGDYALVHRAPIATLDPDEFALPLQVLATVADELEKEFSAGDDF